MRKEFKNIEASLIPYDQNEIETLMKQLMFQNGMTDVMYEGSNVSQLASVISYAISSLNVNTAINLQETILPLATKRMNILMGARQLGYEPRAVTSYKYQLEIKPMFYTGHEVLVYEVPLSEDPHAKKIVDVQDDVFHFGYKIEPYTEFRNGERSYWYTGPAITINPDNGPGQPKGFTNLDVLESRQKDGRTDIIATIEVIEGQLTRSHQDTELQVQAIDYIDEKTTKTKQDYLVPYVNVEQNEGIQAYLTYIDKNGMTRTREHWTVSKSLLVDETLTYNQRKFARMENIILGYPAVFFEFAGLGNGIRSKTQIEFDILQSSGSLGRATENFEVVDARGSEIFEVMEYSMIQEGRLAESDKSIKENAIVFHNTGNRAVTRSDYTSISKKHEAVKEADAWGGEEETPRQKGEIWVSATPRKQYREYKEEFNITTQTYTLQVGTLDKNVDNNKDALLYIPNENQPEKNFQNWYLTEQDWSGFTDKHTRIHNDGLRDYLDTFKIISMGLNYRHPLYIDFEYNIEVVKYDIHTNPEVTNKQVFDTINNYFVNTLEQFEGDYLNSNLQRVIDQGLGFDTGVNFETKLYGVLCEEMIDPYYVEHPQVYPGAVVGSSPIKKERIIINLAWPYEDILPDGIDEKVDSTLLPRIDTDMFTYGSTTATASNKLQVDYIKMEDIVNRTVREIPIYLGAKVNANQVGVYRLDVKKNIIELDLDFGLPGTNKNNQMKIKFFGHHQFYPTDHPTHGLRQDPQFPNDPTKTIGPDEIPARDYNRFKIVYAKAPNDAHTINAPFTKNVIPRLKKVKFNY